MPLTKAQKALYEAALRRKGLQPGKAVRQDPRTFVGPIRTYADVVQRPYDTYWNRRGRLQDLEDELQAANDAGLIELKSPFRQSYRRYYNDGDIPNMPTHWSGRDYNSPYYYRYMVPYAIRTADGMNIGYHPRPHLTRIGELELEARADEMIENDYKDYLKKMYQRFPNRAAVREQFPEEYNAMPYLEELFPEE